MMVKTTYRWLKPPAIIHCPSGALTAQPPEGLQGTDFQSVSRAEANPHHHQQPNTNTTPNAPLPTPLTPRRKMAMLHYIFNFTIQIGRVIMDRIQLDPGVCNGKPVIKGTRIPVSVILDQIAAGEPWDALLSGYPELQKEDIQAALNYASESLGA